MKREKILIVADGPAREWLASALREKEFEVITSEDGYKGIDLLREHRADLVITDLSRHGFDGLYLIRSIKTEGPKVPVIVLIAMEDKSPMSKVMSLESYASVDKPAEMCELERLIAEALRIHLHAAVNVPDLRRIIVGRSAAIIDVRKRIGMISHARAHVLLHGESGTGKRLASRVIHDTGPTKGHPFVGVDLPALPHQHLEELLFGEVREPQSATGRGRKGLFETAGAGTIVLNGISELPMRIQTKLLGAIQMKEFVPVGAGAPVPIKARIIGTTEKELRPLVLASEFREDLFYRLTEGSIKMPPLRERKEDIPGLVLHFLRRINKTLHKCVKRIPGEAIELLKNSDWPGNVAELEEILTRAVVAADGDVLQTEAFVLKHGGYGPQVPGSGETSLEQVKKEHIQYILDQTNWDVKEAARLLNISRQTLYNKIRKYGIVPS